MVNKLKIRNILIIIGIFIVLCIFYTFNIINNNKQNNTVQENHNLKNVSNNTLSKSDAITILKTKVDFAEEYFTNPQLPCGENAEIDDSIPKKNNMDTYYLSKTYSSFDELNNYLLQYMSQNVINLNILYNKDNYIEQNGKLYCLMLQRGNIGNYKDEKTDYKIEDITENSIHANIVSYIEDDQLPEYNVKRYISVVLTKNENNWQITKYDGYNISYYR